MGKLPLPSKDKFELHVGSIVTDIIEQMWNSLWFNYCANLGTTSSIYWMEKLGPENTKSYLSALASLQASGWIVMDTRSNFSSIALNTEKLLEYITEEELSEIRYLKRFDKYLPHVDESVQHGLAEVYVKGKPTGRKLSRSGMEVGAKSQFTFDRAALTKHFDVVRADVRKGIENTLEKHPQMADDGANYAEILDGVLEHLANETVVCNMGVNKVDSRGRAIKSHLDKIMNPVGFKMARALLVIPE